MGQVRRTFFILHPRRAKGYTVEYREFGQVDAGLLLGRLGGGGGLVVVAEVIVDDLLELEMGVLLLMMLLVLVLLLMLVLLLLLLVGVEPLVLGVLRSPLERGRYEFVLDDCRGSPQVDGGRSPEESGVRRPAVWVIPEDVEESRLLGGLRVQEAVVELGLGS